MKGLDQEGIQPTIELSNREVPSMDLSAKGATQSSPARKGWVNTPHNHQSAVSATQENRTNQSEALPHLYLSCHPEHREGPAAPPTHFSRKRAFNRPLFVCHSLRKPAFTLFALALLLTLNPQAHAQGCAQCLDATRSTPPTVQAAYRHAIYLLAGAATTLFTATLLLLRKFR